MFGEHEVSFHMMGRVNTPTGQVNTSIAEIRNLIFACDFWHFLSREVSMILSGEVVILNNYNKMIVFMQIFYFEFFKKSRRILKSS